jgi:hypothetical protein
VKTSGDVVHDGFLGQPAVGNRVELSDRSNWILSGLVGLLIGANGLVLTVQWTARLTGLALGVAMAVAGGLILANAVRAIRDPATVEQDWTRRKTVTNAVALVILVGVLVAAVGPV